nr:nitrogen fixation protein NifQ [Thiocystis violacea]
MVRAAGDGNDRAFASMIATRAAGGGALPAWLGLDLSDFHRLIAHHFPGVSPDVLSATDGGSPLMANRLDEREELIRLLLDHRAHQSLSETWMARTVAAGCMASDHLWHDLGLWNRAELTDLMRRNFPELAARNSRDMKWKRFLYKQLCESEGVYLCRVPSCAVCVDYQVCFGPEE